MELRIDQLTVGYGRHDVLNGLAQNFLSPGITSIIGPNGCGKTTLLKSLGRILSPRQGAVYLDGHAIHHMPTRELATKMALLPQSPKLPTGLNVEELVAFGRYPYRSGIGRLTAEDRDVIHWAIEATELIELRKRPVDSLSGGQRQRSWIAMALAQQTSIILLDEPTTYLDLSFQLEILELLATLHREHKSTIIMVLHEINLASRFSHQIIGMRDGSVVVNGSPRQCITEENLRTLFDIYSHISLDPISGNPLVLSYSRHPVNAPVHAVK